MELAGLHLNEDVSSQVKAAIAKNKTALSAAIEKRLANDEDERPYTEVEKLLIKTAIEAGVSKEFAEDVPWMEYYAIPEESTVNSDLANLEEALIDMVENPEG